MHSAYGGVKAVDVGGQPVVRHNLRDGGPLTASEIKSSTLRELYNTCYVRKVQLLGEDCVDMDKK
jgi:hypothetical protein